jgi:hypothetical protein
MRLDRFVVVLCFLLFSTPFALSQSARPGADVLPSGGTSTSIPGARKKAVVTMHTVRIDNSDVAFPQSETEATTVTLVTGLEAEACSSRVLCLPT